MRAKRRKAAGQERQNRHDAANESKAVEKGRHDKRPKKKEPLTGCPRLSYTQTTVVLVQQSRSGGPGPIPGRKKSADRTPPPKKTQTPKHGLHTHASLMPRVGGAARRQPLAARPSPGAAELHAPCLVGLGTGAFSRLVLFVFFSVDASDHAAASE